MIAPVLLFLIATVAIPAEGRFDLVCTGTRQEAVGPAPQPAEPWSGRLAIDLARKVARRDAEPENLWLQPGPAGRIVIQDEEKSFGDAAIRAHAHVERATGAYLAHTTTEVGEFVLQDTTVRAACTVAPFTRLAPKDAPLPEPEGGPPRPPTPRG